MTLELSDQSLVVKIPDCNVAITAAAEADLGVGADGESIASWSCAGQLSLDARVGSSQVPDRQCAGFSSNHKSSSIRQQLDASDVVLPLKTVQLRDWLLVTRLGDVPHLDTSLASSVHVLGGVGHGHSADHLTMGQSVDLATLSWHSSCGHRVMREGDWLQLIILTNMERVAWLAAGTIDTIADTIG